MNQTAWSLTTSPWNESTTDLTSMITEGSTDGGRHPRPHHRMSTQFLDVVSFLIGSVGSVANGFVLLALLCARQSRRKRINVFIINQSVLDLLACIFLILTIVFGRMKITSIAAKWIVCLLFETNTVLAIASYGSIFGLVVITVERYVKIVHPVIHRNHYRRWMTYAGVILPWVDGICCYLIPAWSTMKMVDGECFNFHWPTRAMFDGYMLTMMFWHYVIPPAFFFFAYSRIIGVIRRQQHRVVAPTASMSASTSYSTQQPEANSSRQQAKHSGEVNIVHTMVIIVVCFCICYLPYKLIFRCPYPVHLTTSKKVQLQSENMFHPKSLSIQQQLIPALQGIPDSASQACDSHQLRRPVYVCCHVLSQPLSQPFHLCLPVRGRAP